MHYSIVNADPKVVVIASKDMTMQDILSVAAKEFPSLPIDQLSITPTYNPDVVYIQQKNPLTV